MSKARSRLRNRAEAAAFALAKGLLGLLPKERAEAAGRAAGGLYGRLDRKRRELAARNLARAFPEKSAGEIAALVRDVFAHFGGMAADLVVTLDEPVEETLARVDVANIEVARAARATGRPLIFLTPHLGNWELAAFAAAANGLAMAVVARPLDNTLLEERLRAFRERTGNRVVPKADAARPILKTLRRAGMVGILVDQHAHPPDAVVAPFFGRPASTTTVVARMADRTEALVLPAHALRVAPRRYRLAFEDPLDVRALAPEEREVGALTSRINRLVEEMVRRDPSQWLWLHNRWRLD